MAKAASRGASRGGSSSSTAKPSASFMTPKANESVSVRRIDNGYVVSKSGVDKKGMYQTKERFTKTLPKV